MKHASVIICHYSQTNDKQIGEYGERSALMKQCLESLDGSTNYPMEVVVVDNGGNPDDSDYLLDATRRGKITTYLRHSQNMFFAYAWNSAARISTGDYLVFTCNDILFKKDWLTSCIELLEKYPDRKFIATPFITPDKDQPNYNKEVLSDGARVNSMAGSNCMVMPYSTYKNIGEIPHHRIGGSLWHRRMIRKDYLVIAPPTNLVEHMAFRKGINWKKPSDVSKVLVNGEKVDFNYRIQGRNYFYGSQRPAGAPLGDI